MMSLMKQMKLRLIDDKLTSNIIHVVQFNIQISDHNSFLMFNHNYRQISNRFRNVMN